MPFDVFIDDNFHYHDESEQLHHGTYETYEEACAVAMRITEESVRGCFAPGMTAEEVLRQYQCFGDDPFVRPGTFSAWTYARAVAERLVAEAGASKAPPEAPQRPASPWPTPVWSRQQGARSDYDPGWAKSAFSDGRPYRAEISLDDRPPSLLFIFSRVGLETFTAKEAERYLEREGLFTYFIGPRTVTVEPTKDDLGNPMWAVKLVLATPASSSNARR